MIDTSNLMTLVLSLITTSKRLIGTFAIKKPICSKIVTIQSAARTKFWRTTTIISGSMTPSMTFTSII